MKRRYASNVDGVYMSHSRLLFSNNNSDDDVRVIVKIGTHEQELICRQCKVIAETLVLKENLLVNMPADFSEREQKIISFTIGQIRNSDSQFKPLIASPDIMAELLNVNTEWLYNDIKTLEVTLKKPALLPQIVDNKIIYSEMPFFSIADFRRSYYVFSINEKLASFLLLLQNNAGQRIAQNYKLGYTMYPLKYYSLLSGKYALRLYELLSQRAYLKSFTISLDNLRKSLRVIDKLIEFKDFKKRILNHAHNQINSKTNLQFEFEVEKSRKFVTALRFNIIDKQAICEEGEIKKELLRFGLSGISVDNIFKKTGISPEVIERNIKFVKMELATKKTIRNPSAFLCAAIEKDYAAKSKETTRETTDETINQHTELAKDIDIYANTSDARIRSLINEYSKDIDEHAKSYLKNLDPRNIIEEYVLKDAKRMIKDFVKSHLKLETVTIDDVMSTPLIFTTVKKYMIKHNILQHQNIIEYLESKGEKVDEIYLMQNGLI
jgi:plasmid replication initiation protein